MSTFTANLDLELVARNADVGTWDTPTNANWSLMDSAVGAITTISLNNSPIILSGSQFQSKGITFNSTLTGSVTITFPTSFTKSYEIQNTCTGSSAFTISLNTTAAGGQSICCPPGETVTVFNDGSNLKFTNLGRIGSYLDYAGASVPFWITSCTVPPYVNCDGTSISSATYPALVQILGTTTLPDRRGTVGIPLNQGTGRVTVVDGNTRFSVGGDQNLQSHSHTGTTGGMSANDPHTHTTAFTGIGGSQAQFFEGQGAAFNVGPLTINSVSIAHTHSFTTNAAGAGGAQNVQPTTVYGICMIRAG
jgi:hypothetical protein